MNKATDNDFVITAPSPGESINEIQVAKWLVKNGDIVAKDQSLLEIESEKASLEITSEKAGQITIIAKEGDVVAVGAKLAVIDTSKAGSVNTASASAKVDAKAAEIPAEKPAQAEAKSEIKASVAADKIIRENNLDSSTIGKSGLGGRITKADVLESQSSSANKPAPSLPANLNKTERSEYKQPMSMLRKKVAERLVAVKNQTAMLTTFNEVDLLAVSQSRKKYKEIFKEKHQIGLGFMSFFAKACTTALLEFPAINGRIDGTNIITTNYVDLGIAVSSPKGLMVPIIRNAEALTMADIEKSIANLAEKARNATITMDEMTGGTFTITNGGVFGSMLSTPIINPPQSAILGMHNIVERPVVIDGEIKIRPIMYLALSYDHRIVDGKDSVSFLFRVKSLLEDPIRLLIGA